MNRVLIICYIFGVIHVQLTEHPSAPKFTFATILSSDLNCSDDFKSDAISEYGLALKKSSMCR